MSSQFGSLGIISFLWEQVAVVEVDLGIIGLYLHGALWVGWNEIKSSFAQQRSEKKAQPPQSERNLFLRSAKGFTLIHLIPLLDCRKFIVKNSITVNHEKIVCLRRLRLHPLECSFNQLLRDHFYMWTTSLEHPSMRNHFYTWAVSLKRCSKCNHLNTT